MKQTLIESLDSFIDLIPNAKEVQIETTKEDVDKLIEAINSETLDEVSWGNFGEESIPESFYTSKYKGFYGLNYRGVNFFFYY